MCEAFAFPESTIRPKVNTSSTSLRDFAVPPAGVAHRGPASAYVRACYLDMTNDQRRTKMTNGIYDEYSAANSTDKETISITRHVHTGIRECFCLS
jgi:hypothetical protein